MPLVRIGLGVGLVGAGLVALRYGFRPPRPRKVPETISPAIFATRVVSTTHGDMVYHVSGAGEPVVFLHGVYPGASSFEWSRVYPSFAVGREVLAPDLIGFGESERPAEALDAGEHVRTLVEFFHEVCPGRRPTIVAAGVGAALALLLASQHPELPRRVIVWLPLGVARPLRRRLARRMLGLGGVPFLRSFVWRNTMGKPSFMRSWLDHLAWEGPGGVDDETVEMLSICAALYGAEHAIWAFLKGRLAVDMRERLANVAAPVSMLWPERSKHFPLRDAETILGGLSRGNLVWTKPHGLLGPLADPEDFRELVGRELDGGLRVPETA